MMFPKPRHIIAVIAIMVGALATFYTGWADGLRLAIMIASFCALVLVYVIGVIDELYSQKTEWHETLDEHR